MNSEFSKSDFAFTGLQGASPAVYTLNDLHGTITAKMLIPNEHKYVTICPVETAYGES